MKFLILLFACYVQAPLNFELIYNSAADKYVVETHPTSDWKKFANGSETILEPLSEYGDMIWCALAERQGFSFFSNTLKVSLKQLRLFVLQFLVKRANYGCGDSLQLLISYSRNFSPLFSSLEPIKVVLGELNRKPVVIFKKLFSDLTEPELERLKEFYFSDFLDVLDSAKKLEKLQRQEMLWNMLISDKIAIDVKKFDFFWRLKEIYWLQDKDMEKYPKTVKICLNSAAREMLELYCGVRFSSDFAGSAEPLEDILVPGIFEKIGIAATGAFESTQATATAALDCVLSLFSKKPTAVVTVPEAQALLGKKKQ